MGETGLVEIATADAGGAPGAVPSAPGSSTVVLVMTDVAGSTRLWAEYPDEMNAVMARHHDIVHAAITAHRGWRPVDQGEGDAVFAAFDSAVAAVTAVRDFQAHLAAQAWPDGVAVSVRVGIHAGEVVSRGGNLFGQTVNRCARLRGLGAGGQVLLSASVYELVRDTLPSGLVLTDLGEHRMKDLARPEHVYQLDLPGLPSVFPPLASLDGAKHNLPIQTTTFLGRTAEIAELVDLFHRERLVSIVGFGGMGKTRLALQVAAELAAELADGIATEFTDGVWFVDLSAVTEPAQIPTLIASALGIGGGHDGVLAAVVRGLAGKKLLLVLDNLEQVLPAAADVVHRIIQAASGVRILTTTREPLRLSGENEYPLAPLPVPPVPRAGSSWTDRELLSLSTFDAVRLFIRRAAAVRRGFTLTATNAAAIAGICHRLDGMPLALELAAARVRVLSPEMLLPRLDHALGVLIGGSRDLPTRQQTLRATITWSYDTLDPPTRTLLNRLSAFPGSFTLDAAEQICGSVSGPAPTGEDVDVLAGVSALVDRCLLTHFPATDDQTDDRYALLVSIREYAAEQLGSAAGTLTDRHAAYYAEVTSFPPDYTREENILTDRIRHEELHNLRAALAHARSSGTAPEELRLALAMSWELITAGLSGELRDVLGHACTRVDEPTPDYVAALVTRTFEALSSGLWGEAQDFARQSVQAARAVGEPSLVIDSLGAALLTAATQQDYDDIVADADPLVVSLPPRGSYRPAWSVRYGWDTAVHMSPLTTDAEREAALRRQLPVAPPSDRPRIESNLGGLLLRQGRLSEARVLLFQFESPEYRSRVPAVMFVAGLTNAIDLRLSAGEFEAAQADLELAETNARGLDQPDLTLFLVYQRAGLERLLGQHDFAAGRLESLLSDESASPINLAWAGHLLAVVRREQHRPEESTALLERAFATAVEMQPPDLDLVLRCLLERAMQITDCRPSEAARLLGLVTANGPRGFCGDALVRYDVESMASGLRALLGDEAFDQIVTKAQSQDLPSNLG